MKDNKFLKWLKRPHGIFLIPLYILAVYFIVSAIIFTTASDEYVVLKILSYVYYGLAAIFLAYSVYTVVLFVPICKRKIIEILQKRDFTARILAHYGYRTIIFSILSFILGVLFAAYNTVIAIYTKTLWYGALAAYYILLVVLRWAVLGYVNKRRKNKQDYTPTERAEREIKIYRTSGVILVILPVCLSFSILEMVESNRAFERLGFTIYVAATYAFYKIIMSCINFFKARKTDDLMVQSTRNINLVDAFVSILALQTSMFHSFAAGQNYAYANAITGAVVCALTVMLGIFMIVGSRQRLKRLKENPEKYLSEQTEKLNKNTDKKTQSEK